MPTRKTSPVKPFNFTNPAEYGSSVALPDVTPVSSYRLVIRWPVLFIVTAPVNVGVVIVDDVIVPPDNAPIVPPIDDAVAMVDPLIVDPVMLENVAAPVEVKSPLIVTFAVIVPPPLIRKYRLSALPTFNNAAEFDDKSESLAVTLVFAVALDVVSKIDGYPLLFGRIVNLRAVLL